MKRLMIVTDNSFAAQSIRLALRQTVGFQMIGFVDGTTPIGARAAEAQPDVVLVDDMQDYDCAIARLEELGTTIPHAKRILLALRMDDVSLAAAFEAGAEAVISKSMHPVSLATGETPFLILKCPTVVPSPVVWLTIDFAWIFSVSVAPPVSVPLTVPV